MIRGVFVKYFFSLFFGFYSITLFADLYSFHPKSRLSLGGGFDKFQPNRAFLKCLDYDEPSEPLENKALLNTSLEITGVSSVKEFHKKIGFSTFLEGSYLFAEGSASASYDLEETFSEKNLTWLVLLKADFGYNSLNNPRLKEEYKSLSHEDLINKCGREIVIEEKRSIVFFSLLTLKDLSHSQKESLSAKLSLLAKGASYKAEFGADYKKFIEKAYSLGQVSVKVFSHGNLPLEPLKNILGVDLFADHNTLLGLFKEYLQGVDSTSAVPSSYITTDIGVFSDKSFSQPSFKKKILIKLYQLYQNLEASLARIKSYYRKGRLGESFFLGLGEEINLKLDKLEHRAQNCFDLSKQESCQNLGLESYDFSLSGLRNKICAKLRKKALDDELVDFEYYKIAEDHNLAPFLKRSSAAAEKSVTWAPCRDLGL